MSWQKCPVCNGTGKSYKGLEVCPTCKGHLILSELTGKPPTYEIKTGISTGIRFSCIRYIPSDDSIESCKLCGRGKWFHQTYVSNPSVAVISSDKCVMCGEDTIYLTNTPVSYRIGYVEGAGQLCSSCYEKS